MATSVAISIVETAERILTQISYYHDMYLE